MKAGQGLQISDIRFQNFCINPLEKFSTSSEVQQNIMTDHAISPCKVSKYIKI